MSPVWTLTLYCGAILVVSVLGGLLPVVVRLTHRRLQFGLALVAGVMLGVGLLHMLGHAVEMASSESSTVSISAVMLAALGGFLVMFLLERFFCFHHHETEDDHGHTCGHSHDSSEQCTEDAPSHSHTFGWTGALVGMTVHTLIAGFALGAAVGAGVERSGASPQTAGLLGIGVFLGILLHKPFDSFTVVALMRREGTSAFAMHLVNALFALVVPLGVLLFVWSSEEIDAATTYTALALAFSGGTFICIASSDLLPELQFHSHDRLGITAAFVIGLAIAWGSGLVGHDHAHGGFDHPHTHDHAHE